MQYRRSTQSPTGGGPQTCRRAAAHREQTYPRPVHRPTAKSPTAAGAHRMTCRVAGATSRCNRPHTEQPDDLSRAGIAPASNDPRGGSSTLRGKSGLNRGEHVVHAAEIVIARCALSRRAAPRYNSGCVVDPSARWGLTPQRLSKIRRQVHSPSRERPVWFLSFWVISAPPVFYPPRSTSQACPTEMEWPPSALLGWCARSPDLATAFASMRARHPPWGARCRNCEGRPHATDLTVGRGPPATPWAQP